MAHLLRHDHLDIKVLLVQGQQPHLTFLHSVTQDNLGYLDTAMACSNAAVVEANCSVADFALEACCTVTYFTLEAATDALVVTSTEAYNGHHRQGSYQDCHPDIAAGRIIAGQHGIAALISGGHQPP